jgi:DNA-binding GntR family transcriptional regulator
MGGFTPIKTSRASEEVFTQIKTSILSGKYRSGSKLPSERELTAVLQVSRGVVREALRMLELSGFLIVRQGHGGGAYVTDLTLSQVGNSFLDLFQTNTLSISWNWRRSIADRCPSIINDTVGVEGHAERLDNTHVRERRCILYPIDDGFLPAIQMEWIRELLMMRFH